MTQDEILKELRIVIAENQQFTTWTISTPHLVELVNRAVKAEREACAKLLDEEALDAFTFDDSLARATENYAELIRARGKA